VVNSTPQRDYCIRSKDYQYNYPRLETNVDPKEQMYVIYLGYVVHIIALCYEIKFFFVFDGLQFSRCL